MAHAIGIDLGTTFSCVAFLEGMKPKVIPNLEGQWTTPSVVNFTSTGQKLVGNLAVRQAVANPDNTIFAIKRIIGKKFNSEEVQETRKRMCYKLAEAENGDVMVVIDSEMVSPQEISATILSYMKKCAEAYFGEEVTEAVITVPANFDDHQRKATKDAAEIAGLEVLRIINEPTSACLAYGIDRKKNAKVAIYDLGGGTFDITLMEVNEGVFHVLATNGCSYLGGEDIDDRIACWIIEEFKNETNIDLSTDKLARHRIKESSERVKRSLSFTFESKISIPFIASDGAHPQHIKTALARKELEALAKDLIEKTYLYIDQALQASKLKTEDIDEVILVGGQTRMPLVKEMIAEYFGKQPIESINPDEIVAQGAAVQSGIIKGQTLDALLLLDVTPLSLGIETENDTFNRIIERNATIPTRMTRAFTTVRHNQTRVQIHVLQGENDKASENISLAKFDLVGIHPAPAGFPQIDVTFEIDANGIVKVSAKDADSGMVRKVEVKPSSGLSQKEMDKIIDRTRGEELPGEWEEGEQEGGEDEEELEESIEEEEDREE